MHINNNNVTLFRHQQVVCERKNGICFGIASNTITAYSACLGAIDKLLKAFS